MKKFITIFLLFLSYASIGWTQSSPASLVGVNIIGDFRNLNLNQTNTDNAVAITAPRYTIRRITVANCSTSLAASAATIGVFTGAGGTGSNIVALAVLTTIALSDDVKDLALLLTTKSFTAQTIYIRNGVAHGSAATCDVRIFGEPLP